MPSKPPKEPQFVGKKTSKKKMRRDEALLRRPIRRPAAAIRAGAR